MHGRDPWKGYLLLVILALVAVLFLAGPWKPAAEQAGTASMAGCPEPPCMLPHGGGSVGGAGYGLNYADPWGSDEDRRAADSAASFLGAEWTRLPAYWYQIQEDGPASWDWSLLDTLVEEAIEDDRRIMMMVLTTPEWARPDGAPSGDSGNKYAPVDSADLGRFVGELVERYQPRGVFDYEIWNEPNIDSFFQHDIDQPGPNVAKYAEMLEAAATAAREVTSDINLISAGLSPARTEPDGSRIHPVDYLEELYDLGAAEYFDSVGFHPYSYPLMPSDAEPGNAWQQMSVESFDDGEVVQASIRSVMEDNGDGSKQVWLTEFGAPTWGEGAIDEYQQAVMYKEAIELHRTYEWAGPLIFYTLQDRVGRPDRFDRENYFGFKRGDGSHKPAMSWVRALIRD